MFIYTIHTHTHTLIWGLSQAKMIPLWNWLSLNSVSFFTFVHPGNVKLYFGLHIQTTRNVVCPCACVCVCVCTIWNFRRKRYQALYIIRCHDLIPLAPQTLVSFSLWGRRLLIRTRIVSYRSTLIPRISPGDSTYPPLFLSLSHHLGNVYLTFFTRIWPTPRLRPLVDSRSVVK